MITGRRRTPSPDVPDRVDVRALFATVWRRRRAIGIGMGTGMVLALGIAFVMTPNYSAMSKIMLEARAPQTTSSQQVVPDIQVTDQVVNSVVSVIQSNVLIEKAIREIGIARFASLDPANQTPSLLDRAKDAITGLFKSDTPTGPALLTPEQAQMERLIWAVSKEMKVSRETQSNVVDIAIEDPDRQRAMLIANALANQFISSQVTNRRDTADDATKWLQDRVAQMKAQVETSEAAVDQYRAKNLTADGGTLDAATQQLNELNNALIQARSDRITAAASYNRVKDVLDKKGIDGISDIVSSPALDALNSQLTTLQQQDAVWAQNYGPTHPERIRLASQIKSVKDSITQELAKIVAQRKSSLATAELREQTMEQSISAMEKRIVTLSQNSIGLRQLERVASSDRAAYNDLLTRLNATQTEAQMQQPDAQLIERASLPGTPSSPRTKLMAIVGAFAGLAIGFGIIFFQELTLAGFAGASELEEATGLPVLTAIPDGQWKAPGDAWAELTRHPYGQYAERIRHLRTALLVKDGATKPRAIMLASSVPGEGKTTTTLALARMAALAGRKVIVVDGDLRRASMAQVLNLRMEEDFADFIASGAPLGRAIQRDAERGFDILAARSPRPDAAEELSETWLAPLVTSLKKVYDLVLIDAPASLAVADALVLARAADESLYLVRWRTTPRQAVEKGLAQFAEAGIGVSGMVMTLVDPRGSSDVYAGNYDYSR